MPVWRFLDRALWMFRGSALPKTLGILGVIAVALIAMFIVQIDFKLKGNGELKPTEEKHVFAHANGNVEEVYVRHGDFVKAGQPLVRMRDDDLSKEIVNLEDQIMQAAQRVENRTRTLTLDASILTPSERERLTQEKIEAETTLKGLETQLQLARQMEAKMVRTSPIDGVVMTWDVERMLNRRPVVMGQVLMTIADKEKDWEVEVLLPEKRMSYLLQAFEDELAKNPSLANPQQLVLPVDFIMMTDPSKSYSGKLSYAGVSGRAELNAEDGPVVKLRCNPDPESLQALSRNPGARVIAKVKAGRRSAAFVWFHEVVEWVRAYLLF